MKLIAKKSLGQNFLHAPHVVSAMVNSAQIDDRSTVLEIGPGTGALTTGLLNKNIRVIAVEKDDRAIPMLKEKFAREISSGQLTIIHADIIDIMKDTEKMSAIGLTDKSYVIVANIPYYITGELLRLTLENTIQPKQIIIMVEKRVVDRIVARDGKESILSLSVKAYGMPKLLMKVSRKLFRPIPSVDSAVLTIDNVSKQFFVEKNITEGGFFEVVRQGFAHKRKILLGNLRNLPDFDEKSLTDLWTREAWSTKIRAEDIPIEGWAKIASVFHKNTP